MRRLLLLVLALCGASALAAEAAAEATAAGNDSSAAFVPTREWQVVEKGTPIPAGLHIRHNLQTGLTEAKLMDDEENKENSEDGSGSRKNSLALHPEKAIKDENTNEFKKAEQNNHPKVPLDELKAMLKKIKSDEADELIQAANEQVHSAVQKEFRSYAELKEELESLSMNVSTDAEVLTSLFEQFEPYKDIIATENLDTKKVDDILDILNDMEYLLHQIDNARLFADMGGMAKIISPSLNCTNSDVKAETLKLLGTAVQSNPRVQLKALENDLVQKILYMLTINNKVNVQSRCLFSLGALVRHFPAAQKNFINNGGLEIFGKILIDGHFQIQTRVMNLVNDLAIERENLKEIQDEEQRLRRKKEYDSTNFEEKIVMQKYCENLVDLSLRSLRITSGIDDFHEVVYESIITLNHICKSEFTSKKDVLLQEIQKMLITYRDFSKISEDGENFSSHNQEILEKIQKILLGETIRDEL